MKPYPFHNRSLVKVRPKEASDKSRWPQNSKVGLMSEKADLDSDKEAQVHEYESASSSVIFEAIRRAGEHELLRPVSALWWSGVAAGLAISTSVLCKGFLVSVLPDADWTPAVSNLGYTVGFLIVILGRMQLFTESTITPILPLFLTPTAAKLLQIGRLWCIVFAANLFGCMLASFILVFGHIVPEVRLDGILSVSRHYAEASAFSHFARGIPAGFLIAALVWVLPRMESAGEVLMIVIVTYVIGLGGMSHVVAGSTELFILVLRGELGIGPAVLGGVLPAFAGNVLGGTGIFVALTYAQLREEI